MPLLKMCPWDLEAGKFLVMLKVEATKCEKRGSEDGVETTLLRRLSVKRSWLEWEHVRGLNSLQCCKKY